MSNVSLDAHDSSKTENQPASSNRRRFLTVATSGVGGIGVVGAAVPFIASWNPSIKAKAAGADVEADISKIQPGQLIRVIWRSQPVWIARRTPELLASLSGFEDQLKDPNSDEEQQPAFAKNQYRSIKEEFLVLVGICTHLGCSPEFKPNPGDVGVTWQGGFYCACHGSRFDLAGRVFKNVPANKNKFAVGHVVI